MCEDLQINRLISAILPPSSGRQIVLLTGARQSGKTTLVRKHYKDLPYFNLDAIEYREQLFNVSTFSWSKEVGHAVIDEIQKEPGLFDKIKFAFDDGAIDFSVLTGSSQVLLLSRVRETLAGRIKLLALYPFMLSELVFKKGVPPENLTLYKLIRAKTLKEVFESLPGSYLGEKQSLLLDEEARLNRWGGMPPLIHLPSEKDRMEWLNDYATTYLERDLLDLARLNDLKPFRKFQKIAALRTASLLNYSDLARDAGTSIETARRYLEYLNISYQTFLIQPYYKNLTSTLVKSPKLYWFDNGIVRHISGLGFKADYGQLYENYIASELVKYLRTMKSRAKLYYYRTRSGMEIDFILETESGIIGIEAKSRSTINSKDFSKLRKLAEVAGKTWLGGIVVHPGSRLQKFDDNHWSIPSSRLFS